MSNKHNKTKAKIDPTIWVAIIGAIATLTVTVIGLPALGTWLNAKLNPTPTVFNSPTIIPYPSVTPFLNIPTELSATPLPINIGDIIPIDTVTSTPEATTEVMTVILTSSANDVKGPKSINFNARDSFISRSNGTTLSCIEKNVCSYTWDVRLNGAIIFGPVQGGSAFSFNFGKKGQYTVVVYVCRGNTCNYGAANVKVR